METLDVVTIARVRTLVASGAARSIRIAAGLSQREIAQAIGGSVAAVSRWESGERAPHGALAVRYGELLERLMARR